jgi:hypothetical protein
MVGSLEAAGNLANDVLQYGGGSWCLRNSQELSMVSPESDAQALSGGIYLDSEKTALSRLTPDGRGECG